MPTHSLRGLTGRGRSAVPGIFLGGLIATALTLTGCTSLGQPHPDATVAPVQAPVDAESVDPVAGQDEDDEAEQDTAEFTIGAVGDLLIHDSVLESASTRGSFDFTPLLEPTRAWSEGVDLALCNMEVPIIEDGETPSGYPIFGAPAELVEDLADLGWDGCSTGTNHSLDRGPATAKHTLDVFDENRLGHVGTARSVAEEQAPQYYELERGGQTITVAQLGATYGTNGLPIPEDEPYIVSLLDAEDIIARAQTARDEGADLVVATLHWGNEYELVADASQTELARELADSGLIDMIIGTHPHVPQEFELLDGGPEGDGMWVAYSLGNFISSQDTECCIAETATGLFLTASVEKPVDGPARVTGMEWTPITVDKEGRHGTYVLTDLLQEQPAQLMLSPETVTDRFERTQRVMENSSGAEFPMRTAPPVPTGDPAVVIPRNS